MDSHRHALLALLVVLVVVLAGCLGGGGGDAASGDEGVDAELGGPGGATIAEDAEAGGATGPQSQFAEATTAGRPTDGGGDDGASTGDSGRDGANESAGRALVRTGNATIEVNNTTAARAELLATVRDFGGFLADSRVRTERIDENRTRTRMALVLRVPATNFTPLVEGTKRLGEVRRSSTNTRDVAGQLVDLQARLDNLRAQRDRLRGLYQNASDTEGVLAIEDRLSEVQAEIERIEARLAGLEGRVSLSTLGVELVEPYPESETAGTAVAWYDTGVVAAFVDSVAGVATSLRAIVVALAYLAPYLLVFGVPALFGVVLYRRGRFGVGRFGGGRAGGDEAEPSNHEGSNNEHSSHEESDHEE